MTQAISRLTAVILLCSGAIGQTKEQQDPFAYNPYDANSGYVLTLATGANPATSKTGARPTTRSPKNWA